MTSARTSGNDRDIHSQEINDIVTLGNEGEARGMNELEIPNLGATGSNPVGDTTTLNELDSF